jgi:hypothetical protein
MVAAAGEEAADLLDYWLSRQPGSAVQVVGRDGDQLEPRVTLSLRDVRRRGPRPRPAVAAVATHLATLPPLGRTRRR